LPGCLWGHLVDRCGSARPARLAEDFRRTWTEMKHLRETPCVLAISEFQRHEMIRSGYDGRNVEVLHLPAPQTLAQIPPLQDGPPMFLFLGRLVPDKGIEWLIRAFARVRRDVRLEVAGEGPQQDEMIALATTLG